MIEILTVVKISLLIIAAFIMRPTALGQAYTSFAMILCVTALCIHTIELLKNKNGHITKKNLIIVTSSAILWGYLVVHAVIVGSNNFENVIKAAIASMVIIVSFSIILSREKDNYLFFHWFIKILGLFSLSYLITVVIGFFVGIERLYLFDFPIKTYDHTALVYFPFTSLSSFMVVGEIEIPRFLGMFREPGILQAFLIWSYFCLKQYGLDSKKMKFILIFGIFGTASTAGMAIFIGTIALKYFLNRKILKSVLLIAFCLIALIYAPFIGLHAKSLTHGASLDVRTEATLIGLEKLKNNPIGTGMYNQEPNDSLNSGINLLAASYMIGAIGVALTLFVFFLPLYKYSYIKDYLIGVAPILITMLYSQPLLDAHLVFVLLLASYNVQFPQSDRIRALRKKKSFKEYRISQA